MEQNYMVKKLVPEIVFYKVPGENKERTWKGANARLKIPYEELESIMYDAPTKFLFEHGYLYIEDQKARIELGLEIGTVEESNELRLVLDEKQIENLLYVESYPAFLKKIVNLGNGTLELLISIAINSKKQLTVEKSDYIRKNYHVDVEVIQRNKRDEKEG